MMKAGLKLGILAMLSMVMPGNVLAEEPVESGAAEVQSESAAVDAQAESVTAEAPTDSVVATNTESAGDSRLGFMNGFELNGYLRHYLSMNLQNQPETKSNDAGKLSMNRLSLLLQLRGPIGPGTVTAIGRFTREHMTDYLRDLQSTAGTDFRSHYDENELRELYLDIPVGDRIKLRLGKQQVVWGETDVFQAMDVVHGYDHSWRSFLEGETEEWRKPLILGNAKIAVPELKGTLQLLVRPGLDRSRDIGNTYDMFGGRWQQNASRGFNLNALFPLNYHHPDGDTDEIHYGGRWSGTIGQRNDLSYSLNYYHTQAQNPVLYPDATAPAVYGPGSNHSYIFPTVDIYGGTLSGQVPIEALDTIYRAEVAFVPDQPFNGASASWVVKKDTVRSMFGLDTNLRLENILGTSNASLLSLQIFDTFILNHKSSDAITNAFGTLEKEHTTWLTALFKLPFKSDTIMGQLIYGQDLSNNGGMIIPSVEFQFGPHWRAKLEGDFFYGGKISNAPGAHEASLFGSFAHSNQVATRITYQF